MAVSIHPAVDNGVRPGSPNFAGGTLTCKCTSAPVTVSLSANTAFNHVCGCTKCWKPAGATFSQVAVVGRDKLTVTANGNKLKVVDETGPDPALRLHAAAACTCTGASRTRGIRSTALISCTPSYPRKMAGRLRSSPLSFPRSSSRAFRPRSMGEVRARLKELKLEPYDCLSPALMDLMATHAPSRRARWPRKEAAAARWP